MWSSCLFLKFYDLPCSLALSRPLLLAKPSQAGSSPLVPFTAKPPYSSRVLLLFTHFHCVDSKHIARDDKRRQGIGFARRFTTKILIKSRSNNCLTLCVSLTHWLFCAVCAVVNFWKPCLKGSLTPNNASKLSCISQHFLIRLLH